MRKLICTICCYVFCTLMVAQEKPTIKVSVSVTHKDKSPLYKATVTLGSSYSSLPSEVMTTTSLKQRYKEELEKVGFSIGMLTETPYDFGYETLGQKKEGLVYEYITASAEDIRKFMKIRPLGIESIYVVSQIEIDVQENRTLSKMAIALAKEKGNAIAFAMDKKLGNIIRVEDILNRWGTPVETSIYYDRPANELKYVLDVTFEIIEE